MRIRGLLFAGLMLVAAGTSVAQAPDAAQPIGTMADLMTSMVYPAANDLLLSITRGGPKDDKEWMAVQRNAVLLGESGNVMMMRGHARDQGQWIANAKMLVDAGAAAYRAARAKDVSALTALETPINASCVSCHKQYRPNVHPRS
jgi:cytochrome c556